MSEYCKKCGDKLPVSDWGLGLCDACKPIGDIERQQLQYNKEIEICAMDNSLYELEQLLERLDAEGRKNSIIERKIDILKKAIARIKEKEEQ